MTVATASGAAPSYLQELLDEIPDSYQPEAFFEVSDEMTVSVSGSSEMQRHEWIEDPTYGKRVQIEVLAQGEKSWDVLALSGANPSTLETGDWVLASFWARASDYSETAVVTAHIERANPTWVGIASFGGTAVGEWRRFIGAGQVSETYGENTVRLSLHLANGIQSIDIAGVSIIKINDSVDPDLLPRGRILYEGMEEEAAWRATAQEMIEENRKGLLKLKLKDLAGAPLSGASVQLELIEHAYDFGTFFSTLFIEESAEGDRYRQWLKDNFNYATAPVYWADWGWANPSRRAEYIEMAARLQQEGIPARAHVLLYPGWKFAPQELRDLAGDPEAFQARILEHFEEIVPIMEGLGIHEYDVTNELRQLTEVTDIVGMEGVVEWFKKVRELDPKSVLYINENTILSDGGTNEAAHDHYFQTIEELIALGAPLDGIGMQGHFTETVTPPARLWEILDRFSVFELPIRVTEYDLTTRDLEGQARYDTDFFTALFAHPATVGITRWGFYEPEMWRPLGAIIDAEGNYKPNGIAQRELLFETLKTEGSFPANTSGEVEVSAFYGTYRLRVSFGEEVQELELEFNADTLDELGVMQVVLPMGEGKLALETEVTDAHLSVNWRNASVPIEYEVWMSSDLINWTKDWAVIGEPQVDGYSWSKPIEGVSLFAKIQMR